MKTMRTETRDLVAEFNKTEDDLKALQVPHAPACQAACEIPGDRSLDDIFACLRSSWPFNALFEGMICCIVWERHLQYPL